MSNFLAIAAVTETLRLVLNRGGIPNVTARPLDTARSGIDGDQINLFLYQTGVDAALRNQPPPSPGTALSAAIPPPMPLNLYYLVTAYGGAGSDEESKAHEVLGNAIRVLHDSPLLMREDIRAATSLTFPSSNLHEQIERVRLSWQPLNLEEMTKLWTTFQTGYRLSVAYEAAVVLIESERPGVSPAPVLQRGEADRGPVAVPGVPIPFLRELRPPNRQSAALLGDTIALQADGQLAGAELRLRRFGAGEQAHALTAPVTSGPGGALSFTATAADFPTAGVYAVSLAIPSPLAAGRFLSSNELPLAVAARITAAAPPQIVETTTPPGAAQRTFDLTLGVSFEPSAKPGQRISLLLGPAIEIPLAQPLPAPSGTLQFTLSLTKSELDGLAGRNMLRLRVDGVDMPAITMVNGAPEFAAAQFVTITP